VMINQLHRDHNEQLNAIISKYEADIKAMKLEQEEKLKEVQSSADDAKSIECAHLLQKCRRLEEILDGNNKDSQLTSDEAVDSSIIIEDLNQTVQSQLLQINQLTSELLKTKDRLQQIESEYESYRINNTLELTRAQEMCGSNNGDSVASSSEDTLGSNLEGSLPVNSTNMNSDQFQAYRDNSKFVNNIKAHSSEYIRKSRKTELNQEVIEYLLVHAHFVCYLSLFLQQIEYCHF